jgi:O-antigen/teichoic acid export membrane protein
LLLIRYTPTREYGYYVLVLNAVTLLVGVQNTFISPQMVLRLVRGAASQRADLVGGLYRSQLRLLPAVAGVGMVIVLLLYLLGRLPPHRLWLLCAGTIAILSSLYREFFRLVLFSYRLPRDVLKADAVYTLLLVGGAALASFSGDSASITMASMMSFAAFCGGFLCSRSLWRHEPWNISGGRGILREIAPHGMWTTSGSVIHWLLSQGFNFLVAAVLSATAVGALAATRLFIMPVNMLSMGIGTTIYPVVAAWLDAHGPLTVLRRLLLIVAALVAVAVCYFGVVWLAREWIFAHILRKHIHDSDTLMLLWFAIGILMLIRDQIIYLPLARARYPALTFVTAFAAVVALAVCYFVLHLAGVTGALWGVLAGESVNVLGLLTLSLMETRRPAIAPA